MEYIYLVHNTKADSDGVFVGATDYETMVAYCKVNQLDESYIQTIPNLTSYKTEFISKANDLVYGLKFDENYDGYFDIELIQFSPETKSSMSIDRNTGLIHSILILDDDITVSNAWDVFKTNVGQLLQSDKNYLKWHYTNQPDFDINYKNPEDVFNEKYNVVCDKSYKTFCDAINSCKI